MQEKIKYLFFNETLRRWHFKDILKETNISRERVNFYLNNLLKIGIIKKIKQKGKMPYYIADRDSDIFRAEKKIYGILILEKSGLIKQLSSLDEIKTAIIFGSFSRGDWNKSSDIDLFVYGDDNNLDKAQIEKNTNRGLQIFSYKNIKDIKNDLDPKVIPNIIKGFNIKGSLEPFKVSINA